jgi:hypothetical protein
MIKNVLKNFLVVFTFATFVAACSPEVGSEGWCADMKEQDKGTWTADDAGNFAKHCIM